MSERTVKLGSFAPGINNRLEPTKLATTLPDRSAGTYLYGADNVDLGGDGYLKRRPGRERVLTANCHSLWGDQMGAYVVADDALAKLSMLNEATAGLITVRNAIGPYPVSYSRGADGDVYWSNAIVIRRIANSADRPIAPSAPNPEPVCTITSGALAAGQYLIAFTQQTIDGESPATTVRALDLPANSGVSIASATSVCVYMSACDGDVLTLQALNITAGTVVTHVNNTTRCMTLNRAVMPAGQIVRHFQGRMLVAAGTVMYVSDPYYYGLYNPSAGYIPFPSAVTVIAPTDNGVYICADKTYWLSNVESGELQEVLPYGGLLGSDGRSPDNETVFWQSPRGLVVADKNMSVKNVQEKALDFGAASSGASLYRERDGMAHVVASRASASLPAAAASSYMEARVIQKGTNV